MTNKRKMKMSEILFRTSDGRDINLNGYGVRKVIVKEKEDGVEIRVLTRRGNFSNTYSGEEAVGVINILSKRYDIRGWNSEERRKGIDELVTALDKVAKEKENGDK